MRFQDTKVRQMAKREFIDRDVIYNTLLEKEEYCRDEFLKITNNAFYKNAINGRIYGFAIAKCMVADAPSLTEQEIVKPYLELLLKEMHSLEEINHADNRYDKGYQHGRASCEAMVMHMIDNLLSEQENRQMGMSIETAIRNLSMYDVNECGNAELHTWYKDIDKDMKDSLNVALDVMCKYQKIQEIVTNDELEWGNTSVRANALWDVKKVVEDGND